MPQPERNHGRYSCCPRAIRTNKDEIRVRLRKKGTNSERRVIRWETELVTKALKARLTVTIDNTHLGRRGANFFHSHGDHPVVVRGILAHGATLHPSDEDLSPGTPVCIGSVC
jgi:hypothetical protein